MDDRLLKLLADLRFALGDNGARMQDELVEYAKQIKAKADEADALREELARAKRVESPIPLSGVKFGVRGDDMYFSIGNQSFRLAYAPEGPEEFDFMRRMLLGAFSRLVASASAPQAQERYTLEWVNGPLPEGTELYAAPPKVEQVERVAWDVTKDGRLIYDYDFTHDVVLRVMGDFEDDEQRVRYAKQIVDKLNATLAQQDEPVEVAERERVASQWDGCVTHQLDTFGPVDIGASIRAGELVEAQQAEPVEPVACPSCEELGYVPLSEDGRSVFIDGAGEVPLAQQAEPAYKVKVTGRWHDTEPLAAAFSLPDGEHLLYTAPPPPQRKSLTGLDMFLDPNDGLKPKPYKPHAPDCKKNNAITAIRAALAQQAEPDLSRCPQCNGPADNGFDRSFPPSPYLCTKCMAEPVEPVATLTAQRVVLLEALKAMLARDEQNTCQHQNTHRGGVIWEVCDGCGRMWADDKGGKPEWEDPKEWTQARAAIAAVEGPPHGIGQS